MSEAERLSVPESAEIRELPIQLGTPVRLVKVDPTTLQSQQLLSGIAGGFVHASVGQSAYVYNPACEVSQDGPVFFTAKTSKISRIEQQAGMYVLRTSSGSTYVVIITDGEPMIHPAQQALPQFQPRPPDADFSQPPVRRADLLGQDEALPVHQEVAGTGWGIQAAIAWLFTRKRK